MTSLRTHLSTISPTTSYLIPSLIPYHFTPPTSRSFSPFSPSSTPPTSSPTAASLSHTSPLPASLLTGQPNSDVPWGFKVGYTGPQYPCPSSNLRSARPQVIDKYLEAECQVGHTLGPFPSPPLPNIGAVPRRRLGIWCLIMHLSYHNAAEYVYPIMPGDAISIILVIVELNSSAYCTATLMNI